MRKAAFLFILIGISALVDLPAVAREEPLPGFLEMPQPENQLLEFEKRVAANLDKVEEFRFIKAWTKERGITAYLFGGTASAFGVYTRWETEFQEGRRRF